MDNKLKQLLQKLKYRIEHSTNENETKAAKAILEKMLKKHGIQESDLNDFKREIYDFSSKAFTQIINNYCASKLGFVIHDRNPSFFRTQKKGIFLAIEFDVDQNESEAIDSAFKIYEPQFKKKLKDFEKDFKEKVDQAKEAVKEANDQLKKLMQSKEKHLEAMVYAFLYDADLLVHGEHEDDEEMDHETLKNIQREIEKYENNHLQRPEQSLGDKSQKIAIGVETK